MNELAGLALLYLIGADTVEGKAGAVVEVGYDSGLPRLGIGVGYVNLFDEKNSGRFPPYRKPTDTAEQYQEGVPDASGPGFEANLREQFERRKSQGFKYVELDNPDAYTLSDVLKATDWAAEYGLGVIAKNAALLSGGAQWLKHSNVYGVIVERDAGSPSGMAKLRPSSDFPVWFVSFGSGRAWASLVAADITARGYPNMSVTWSSQGEYERSMDILMPQKQQSQSSGWRVARSLETLRTQVNAAWPNRDKSSDGTIGDTSHQATNSDHNPNAAGVVTAMDITHDPSHGLDARKFAETLVASRDPRIKYIISNAQIISSTVSPWVWRAYSGANAHRQHCHISVGPDPSQYDDPRSWDIGGTVARPAITVSARRFTNIMATEFGGNTDPNNSAYDDHFITDSELGVALPARVASPRPKVRVWKGGRSVDCSIVDVGPWNTNDPYWTTGARPQAESGTDTRGRSTNLAGIDLTPAAARAIGLNGLDRVDWEFIGDIQMPEPEIIPPDKLDPFFRALKEALEPLRPQLLAAFQQAAMAQLQQQLPPPPPPPVATPASQKPSVQLGVFGLVASAVLQAFGVIGTPLGMGVEPTTVGTAATVIPAAIAATGLTGIWGTVANIGLNVAASLLKNRLQQKQGN